MSGNYDYPPASRRASRGSRTSDRQQRPTVNRLQHLRDLLSSERNRNNSTTARALETLNQELHVYRSGYVRDRSSIEQARTAIDQQIQQLREDTFRREDRTNGAPPGYLHPVTQRLSTLNLPVMNSDLTPSDSSRPASSGRSSRRRVMRGGERSSREGTGDVSINSLIDQPIPHMESPSVMPLEPDVDRQADQWRVKRRKLESDDNREGLQAFRYGQYGQVVPGALRMEIVSCDGGTYEADGESSWPENILRNDSSVYCTKSDRCNLILKHRGETPFCLKKLVIKAPKSGYDAPIQEGMVFVSMTSDQSLTHAATYYVQTSTSDSDSDSDTSSLAEADTPAPMTEFQITTEYDENSELNDLFGIENEDELPSVTQIERMQTDPMEDDLLCSDSDESESDDDTSELSTFHRRRRELQRRMRTMRRQYVTERRELQRQSQIPSLVEPAAPSVIPAGPRRPVLDPCQPMLKPHARFFIERGKSMVSIKFDPPASGKYILIKLWSPYNNSNIDIQSIIAHGFAGPRFFPAGNFR